MRSRTWSETRLDSTHRNGTDGVVRVFLRGLGESVRRARQRRDLAALSDYHLRDIGLCRTDVEREIGKPFWRN
jgi:uncharacterized protein YjiS (DUF1127 family)